MKRPKPRTAADFVRDMKARDRTDTEILIVASCTRWEPHKAEVAALLKGGPCENDQCKYNTGECYSPGNPGCKLLDRTTLTMPLRMLKRKGGSDGS